MFSTNTFRRYPCVNGPDCDVPLCVFGHPGRDAESEPPTGSTSSTPHTSNDNSNGTKVDHDQEQQSSNPSKRVKKNYEETHYIDDLSNGPYSTAIDTLKAEKATEAEKSSGQKNQSTPESTTPAAAVGTQTSSATGLKQDDSTPSKGENYNTSGLTGRQMSKLKKKQKRLLQEAEEQQNESNNKSGVQILNDKKLKGQQSSGNSGQSMSDMITQLTKAAGSSHKSSIKLQGLDDDEEDDDDDELIDYDGYNGEREANWQHIRLGTDGIQRTSLKTNASNHALEGARAYNLLQPPKIKPSTRLTHALKPRQKNIEKIFKEYLRIYKNIQDKTIRFQLSVYHSYLQEEWVVENSTPSGYTGRALEALSFLKRRRCCTGVKDIGIYPHYKLQSELSARSSGITDEDIKYLLTPIQSLVLMDYPLVDSSNDMEEILKFKKYLPPRNRRAALEPRPAAPKTGDENNAETKTEEVKPVEKTDEERAKERAEFRAAAMARAQEEARLFTLEKEEAAKNKLSREVLKAHRDDMLAKLAKDEKFESIADATCDRCQNKFRPHWPLSEEDKKCCVSHYGRYNRKQEQWSCCQADITNIGCEYFPHVARETSDTLDAAYPYQWLVPKESEGDEDVLLEEKNNLPNSLKTLLEEKMKNIPSPAFLILDCEMGYTIEGMSLMRVTFTTQDNKEFFDTLVIPDFPVVDFNSRYSGIKSLEGGMTFSQVRTFVRLLFKDTKDLVIGGHSLENDFKSLRLGHDRIVDTVHLFPHFNGLPFRFSLKHLVRYFLGKDIQSGYGHDSKEDCIATCDVIKFYVDKQRTYQAKHKK